jgi:hypothetical protein
MRQTLFLLLLSVSIGVAATADISQGSTNRHTRISLSVTTNDAVLIQTAGGLKAVVQFTAFGHLTASYRWRFLDQGNSKPVTGTGTVRADYEEIETSPGRYIAKPRPKNDTKVRAGDIWIDWYYTSTTSGCLFYEPSLATLEIFPAKDFDSKP